MPRDSLSRFAPNWGCDNWSLPDCRTDVYSSQQVFRKRPPLESSFKPRFRGFFLPPRIVMNSLTQITQVRLIQLRWLSILAMLLAALVSPNILGSSSLMPRLLAFVTLIAAINFCLHMAVLLYRGAKEDFPVFSPLIQLMIDLASWASYVYLSGGATNPLISGFLPLVAIGAIVLRPAQAWFLGIAAILAYSFLWRFYQPLAIPDAETATRLHLLGMWLVFVVSALVVIWFIQQMTRAIHQRDAALAEARERGIRNDWLISMGSLAAGAAHELSTPLATMQVLIDDWLDDQFLLTEQHRDLRLMQAQITACKLALSQLAQRAGHPRDAGAEHVMAEPWLRSVVAAWGALNPASSLLLQLENELSDCAIVVDITLERALCNLLDNARRAEARQIVVSGRLDTGCLTLSIEDDGHGISVEALQAFVAGVPTVSNTGMGIGLLLARSAFERRGGRLSLQRLDGCGTRADIVIPLELGKEKPQA